MHLNFKASHTRSAHERPCVKTREVADSNCALSFLVYFGFACGPTFHESHIFFSLPSFSITLISPKCYKHRRMHESWIKLILRPDSQHCCLMVGVTVGPQFRTRPALCVNSLPTT